jgi:hypothetical protein
MMLVARFTRPAGFAARLPRWSAAMASPLAASMGCAAAAVVGFFAVGRALAG